VKRVLDANPTQTRIIRGLGVLFLLTGLLANPWLLARLKPTGEIGIGLVLLILIFDLCMLVEGCSFLLAKRKITIFRTVLATLCLNFWILILLVGTELYLANQPSSDSPYHSFHIQHLNPFYFFSLPFEEKVLARINNSVVSVTPEGFRGQGPEQKGSRKLAFVLGGSAAFGDGASSDQTTISGYLNRLQPVYHFVNAGVPSWNSTQEFYRVAMQLLQYQPEIIVVYDGYNDVSIDHGYRRDKMPFPPGTPESFDQLARWVDDIRAQSHDPFVKFNPSRLYNLTFPRTRTAISEALDMSGEGISENSPRKDMVPVALEAVARDAASSYLWNIGNMDRLAAAHGTRLVILWQAALLLHRTPTFAERKALGEENGQFLEYLRRFHQYTIEHRDRRLEFYDLSDLFDRYSDEVRVADLFTDEIHLTDQGNRIMANEIWGRISAPVMQ
jgi:lysophospholipase L1-like esterase